MSIELRQAAQQALEALIEASGCVTNSTFVKVMMARDSLVEALSHQPATPEPVTGDEPETPILRALDHLAKGRFVSLDEAVAAANAALIFYRGRTALKANTAPQAPSAPADVVRDAERWRTFLATRPSNTHEGIIAAIDAAKESK